MIERTSISPNSLSSVGKDEETKFYNDKNIAKTWYYEGSPSSDLRIDVESVWPDYTGEGVSVAVLDSQIDFDHKELKNAYDHENDYNFDLDSSEGIKITADTNPHGTSVAGVISGEADNGLGSAGVAHGADLVGLAINYSSSEVVEQAMSGLNAGAAFDVINNSWGFSENFYDDFSNPENNYMEAALENLAGNGRDGLGTVTVFSAGNGGVTGASNYHNFQNSPYSISVGAVDRDGDASSFTSVGANVLLSAAGSRVFTTDLGKGDEFNSSASGTSFAAPAVSGVAALILEANDTLGYRDVQQILAQSAVKEGLEKIDKDANPWVTNGAETFNGGGMHFSDSFGYGFLNAHNAVRLAETWTDQQTLQNRETITHEVDVDEYIVSGENDLLEVEIVVKDDIQVEHIQLAMDISLPSTLAKEISVWLQSPDGTSVELVHDTDVYQGKGWTDGFQFSSVASMGEMSAGTWKLIIDSGNTSAVNRNGDPLTARLKEVELTVHGSGETADDVYVYTNEFGTLYSAAELAERINLTDADGGIDAVNASAVTSDSVISLNADASSVIAGVVLQIDSSIENVYAGDGNDYIFGNAGDNLLWGGRGNDHIDGGDGLDTAWFGSAISDFTFSFNSLYDVVVETVSNIDWGIDELFNVEFYQFDDLLISAEDLFGTYGDELTPPEDIDDPSDNDADDGDNTDGGQTDEDDQANDEGDEVNDGGDTAEPDLPVDDRSDHNPITGTEGNDKIEGTEGDDLIYGLDGKDKINGGSGEDILFAGRGNDRLTGGEGADIFAFEDYEGKSTNIIFDFEIGEDFISLGEGLLLNSTRENKSGDVRLEVGKGEYIVMKGISESEFLASQELVFTDMLFA